MVGSDIASIEAMAATEVKFSALQDEWFDKVVDPREAIASTNHLLDKRSPCFED